MKKKLSLFVVALSILLASLILPIPAFAEPKTTSLDEIVVTATKIEEPKKDVSASVQIITQEDIKNSTAKNVGDLIAEAALGHVHKYPGALTARIGLRGLFTDLFDPQKDRVLVLTNGRPAGTNNLATMPVDGIERIEIVKGPASVLYGSSAMGGVINVITKQGKEGFQGSIGGEVGSWDYWKTEAELSGKKGAFDFYITGSRSQRGDYEAKVKDKNGSPYGKNTGYDDAAISARVGYKFAGEHHVSVGLQHWKTWDMGSPNAFYSPDYDDKMDKERTSFDIGYKGIVDIQYYLNKDKGTWHTIGGAYPETSTTTRDSQGVNLQKVIPLDDHRIIIGGQWDRKEVKSWRSAGAPYYPLSEFDTYGVFSEGRLSLFNKELLLSAGVRYDYFENEIFATPGMTSLKPRKENLDHLTMRGGLVYKITDSLIMKGNAGSAFRAPTPDELAMDTVSWGTRYLGNPNLKPEKSISYDAGIEYSKDLFKSGLVFFHTRFEDKIVRYFEPSLNAQTYKNIDGARLQGFEANLSYDIGLASGFNVSIEPFTNITYHTKYSSKDPAEIKAGSKTLKYTPKWTGAFGVKAGRDKWDVRLIANYTAGEKVDDWNTNSPTYGKVINKGGFTVAHLKGSYRPIKNIEVTASVENLFDRAYGYVLGYPMPGRTLTGGVKWVF